MRQKTATVHPPMVLLAALVPVASAGEPGRPELVGHARDRSSLAFAEQLRGRPHRQGLPPFFTLPSSVCYALSSAALSRIAAGHPPHFAADGHRKTHCEILLSFAPQTSYLIGLMRSATTLPVPLGMLLVAPFFGKRLERFHA